MGYTQNEIAEKCRAAMADIGNFYKQDFINYRGVTTDTGRLYTEVIAEFVIEHIDCFKNKIPRITRESSYRTETHIGEINPNSNREEEKLAIEMFNQSKDAPFDCIGTIIDYQTPLKNERSDDVGKIDLLSDDGKRLIILELKRPRSTETMLRCVLEGYTYLKTVDQAKLLDNFEMPKSYGLSASPLVSVKGEQRSEMGEDRPALHKLMELLESKPYYFDKKNGKFIITEE